MSILKEEGPLRKWLRTREPLLKRSLSNPFTLEEYRRLAGTEVLLRMAKESLEEAKATIRREMSDVIVLVPETIEPYRDRLHDAFLKIPEHIDDATDYLSYLIDVVKKTMALGVKE